MRGECITVLDRDVVKLACARRVERKIQWRRVLQYGFETGTVMRRDEGTTWVRGWEETPTTIAWRVAIALRDDRPLEGRQSSIRI